MLQIFICAHDASFEYNVDTLVYNNKFGYVEGCGTPILYVNNRYAGANLGVPILGSYQREQEFILKIDNFVIPQGAIVRTASLKIGSNTAFSNDSINGEIINCKIYCNDVDSAVAVFKISRPIGRQTCWNLNISRWDYEDIKISGIYV